MFVKQGERGHVTVQMATAVMKNFPAAVEHYRRSETVLLHLWFSMAGCSEPRNNRANLKLVTISNSGTQTYFIPSQLVSKLKKNKTKKPCHSY